MFTKLTSRERVTSRRAKLYLQWAVVTRYMVFGITVAKVIKELG